MINHTNTAPSIPREVKELIAQAIDNKDSICIDVEDQQLSQNLTTYVASHISDDANTIYINNTNHEPGRLIELALRCRPNWIVTPKIAEHSLRSVELAIETGHSCIIQSDVTSKLIDWTIHLESPERIAIVNQSTTEKGSTPYDVARH